MLIEELLIDMIEELTDTFTEELPTLMVFAKKPDTEFTVLLVNVEVPKVIDVEFTVPLTVVLPTEILELTLKVFVTKALEVKVPVIAALPTAVFESTVTALFDNANASSFVRLRQKSKVLVTDVF
jgi:hypothetical protein